MRENCRSFARATINRHTMQLIKKIIIGLIILVIVAAVVSLFFLNEAQRMIVGMAAGLGVINLLGVLYFVQKRGRRPWTAGLLPLGSFVMTSSPSALAASQAQPEPKSVVQAVRNSCWKASKLPHLATIAWGSRLELHKLILRAVL